jgi:HAD superfamily hydrolase (TIGR01484 family)
MAIKLLVFDIDGTLAPTEEPLSPAVGEKLRIYEEKGLQLVFISGRTASYLAGLARGAGIKRALAAGENGGVIFNPKPNGEN